ncbi:nuclear transport factor 2 family protein [Flavobacteriaceae bacterium]|nr:nuclear transport factor 2 family protein [Flavobacteriaceae bacterium]MDA9125078.1 nuclear transport factor 2 family protein [Flavobacteriaceae bacterium]MDC0117318.1 nuclear transport factor 2 family protein [Flavobacteriaceae bacterium]
MKKLLLLSLITLFISCADQNQECEIISNGFTSSEGEQVTMGSQETVDVFLKIDKAWNERDYDAIRSLVSEDAELVNEKGEVLIGAQAFADYIEKDYQETVVQNGQEWGWTINYAFAVKPTSSDRGEYVNARFTGSTGVYEEWYQIADGKLISWTQSKRTLSVE